MDLRDNTPQVVFPQIANRGFEVQVTSYLTGGNSWSPLDVPSNLPFFSNSNRTATVTDALQGETNKFYRVRVYEP